ncbi:MAG: Holliday junction resolvase RuvX [Gammaproteobacteria bacterium]|nr:MAG: Holliday junction resolvase RuvX [Gammaproteobacteria bacterium]
MADSRRATADRSALGFDYGLRWIGVATGQTTTGTATPLTRLSARDGVPDWEVVETLLATWQPDVAVIGLPLNMDGSESELCVRARRFGRRLAGRFGQIVEFQDERLTTREAYARLATRPSKEADHAVAAQVILEDWLAAQH